MTNQPAPRAMLYGRHFIITLCLVMACLITPAHGKTQGGRALQPGGAAGAVPMTVELYYNWNTFLGGPAVDYGNAMAVDSNGNTYVAGRGSGGWAETPLSPRTDDGVFVAKVAIDGTMTWYTWIPGTDYEYVYAMATDSSGNVYVGGASGSTWGKPIRAFAGVDWGNAFVAKYSPDGALLWHTFLGGERFCNTLALTLDSAGNIYASGSSMGEWAEAPVRAHTGDGSMDGFVAKLAPDGSLLWHTFLGTTDGDWAKGLTVAPDGNIYVAGESNATWGSPIREYSSRNDGFVAKLTSSGALVWNTFLGGSSSDVASGVAVDPAGNVYVVGASASTWGDNPVRAYRDYDDAYVAQLTSDGILGWHTFLGADHYDSGVAIIADSKGSVFVGGHAFGTFGSPTRPYKGDYDGYVAQLNASDGALTWNTFIGGPDEDLLRGMGMDASGNIFVAGYSHYKWGNPVRAFSDSYDTWVVMLTTSSSFVLTASITGTGHGAVTSVPSGMTCSGSGCSGSFAPSTSVTLTATADPGSVFAGWGGACSGVGTCTVSMISAKSVSAEFTANTYTISASVTGGHGTLSPESQGVSYGQSATITMTPDTGYRIGTLTDNGVPVTGAKKRGGSAKPNAIPNPYTIANITTDHTVAVTYEIRTETLTAMRTGTGSGTISAAGLSCSGNTCSGAYSYGTPVTVTAAPDTGSALTGWSGCNSTSNNVCMVTMTDTKNITATFTSTNPCAYTISSSPKKPLSYRKGNATITVKATGAVTCANPTVSASDTWIGAALTSFKKNKGTVKVTISPNDTNTERPGSVTIEGNTFAFTQSGAPCSIAIAPAKDEFDSQGGSDSFTVTAVTGCSWNTEVDSKSTSWLSATPASWSGSGPVSYTALGNGTKKARSGKITVSLTGTSKKKVFTVTEKK